MSYLNKICTQYISQLRILSSGKKRHKTFITLCLLKATIKHQISLDCYNNEMRTTPTLFLPHREIPVFDGDPLQFTSFIKAFEHCVEAKTNNKGNCLYYFEQFTKEQSRNLVCSCFHMAPERVPLVLLCKLLLQQLCRQKLRWPNPSNLSSEMEKVAGGSSKGGLKVNRNIKPVGFVRIWDLESARCITSMMLVKLDTARLRTSECRILRKWFMLLSCLVNQEWLITILRLELMAGVKGCSCLDVETEKLYWS